MSQKCLPGTGNLSGCSSSLLLLSHLWKQHSYSFHWLMNPHWYSTTSLHLCSSIYILFFVLPYCQPSPASQRCTVHSEIEGLHIPFCLKTTWSSGLAMTLTTSDTLI